MELKLVVYILMLLFMAGVGVLEFLRWVKD
jgi:hypothetical protein